MDRKNHLDALRGWAIFFVIAYHVSFPIGGNFPRHIEDGARGVELFYMLSAITLFMSLDAKKEGDPHWIFNFFIRRFFRIATMFYVAIPFAIFASSGWSVSAALNSDIGILHALSLLIFTHGLSPYYINSVIRAEWSIAIEMMFYLMVPFLFCRIKKTYQAVYLTIILAIVGDKISGWAADHPPINDLGLWNQYLKFWIVNHMADFSMGILVYFLCKLEIDKKTGNSLISCPFGPLAGCVWDFCARLARAGRG